MIVISIVSILISIAVYFGVSTILWNFSSTADPFGLSMLTVIITLIIVSYIFAFRDFRNSPNGRIKNPEFHKHFFRTLLVNLVLGIIIVFVLGGI